MLKFFKQTSSLAIFSFLLAIFSFLIFIFEEYFNFNFSYEISCKVRPNVALIAGLSGIIALIHIKKTGLKGKWFAILAIILGFLGFSLVCL